VPEQFIAISRAPTQAETPHKGAWQLLRFGREDDFEVVSILPEGEPRSNVDDQAITSLTARRLLNGRTTFVRDRSDAVALRTSLELSTTVPIVSLDELGETFFLNGDWQEIDFHSSNETESNRIAHAVRVALARIAEFDNVTLTRAVSLAESANWPVASLLKDELELRQTQPILLRPDYRYGAHELSFLTTRERPEPLKRTGSKDGVATAEIVETLGSAGGFSRVMPGFEVRRAQQAMSSAVASALNDDGWLLVEAGTGTGKSMAYLLPAARFALERGERVVISTNTKALQDQLMSKDIPDLQRALIASGRDEKLHTAVVKGRSNYVCLRRWFAHERQPPIASSDAGLRARSISGCH
jgi:DEAD/DEAH box helicase